MLAVPALTVTAIFVCFFPCDCRRFPRGNSTCPVLHQCLCDVTPTGLRAHCENVSSVEDLPGDISRLAGKTVRTLTLRHVNITVVPASYFANITLRALNVEHCSVESLDRDALAGVGTLKILSLSSNRLTTVPEALREVKALSLLYLANNRIQFLGDQLTHLSSSLHSLALEGNMITAFHEDALKDMTVLENLWLLKNRIRDIPKTLFSRTPALKMLDLRSNLLHRVGSSLNKLTALQVLLLDNNDMENIYRLSAANLPSLKKLVLDGNPTVAITLFGPVNLALEELSIRSCNVSVVNAAAFAPLQRLKHLHLSNNSISYITGTAFHKQSQLTSFKAAENSISSLNGTFSRTSRLQIIDLTSNKLKSVSSAFLGLGLLTELKLNNNEIEYIDDDTFATNSNLKKLHLGGNKISWLGRNCFRGLVSLKMLFMANNRVMSLNGSLSYMPTLELLYLHDNRLQVLSEGDFVSVPKLRNLYLLRNQLTGVRGAFRHLQRLESLLLRNNSLEFLHRASFPAESMRLKVLAVDGNPLTCDCRLSWLSELPSGVTEGNPVCASPPWLKDAPLLNPATAITLMTWPGNCDDRCTCTCREDGSYGKYTHVNCSNANLTRPPDTFPKDAYVLDLSGNRLEALGSSFADDVPHLQSLLLSHNLFEALDVERIPRGLMSLAIQNNRFTHFPIDVVSQLNLSSLWLAENPWACDCEDYAFRQWAASNEKTVKDAAAILCAEGSNPRVSSKAFMTLEQRDFCPSTMALLLTLGSTGFVLLTLALCLAVAYLKRERQVKVWLYAHGMQCVKEDDLDRDKVFDVFLSFSSKDGDWAYANLVPGLEGAGFSVCTYDRNFKGGFILQDIIQEAVACSRRTLLLLTQNFVKSEWCRWEFRVAHHRALEEKVNRLIVIVPHSVPEGVDEDLALYMEATNYLRWGEKHFWDKLMYSLPKKDEKPRASPDPGSTPLTIIYAVQK